MEKITATINFWYSTQVEIEVEDPEDTHEIDNKLEAIANEFSVYDGNNHWRNDFDDYEIEID